MDFKQVAMALIRRSRNHSIFFFEIEEFGSELTSPHFCVCVEMIMDPVPYLEQVSNNTCQDRH